MLQQNLFLIDVLKTLAAKKRKESEGEREMKKGDGNVQGSARTSDVSSVQKKVEYRWIAILETLYFISQISSKIQQAVPQSAEYV